MNYLKLTLAVAAGILLAGAIVVSVMELGEYRRQQRIRARYMASGSCSQTGNCSDGPYARALKSLGGNAEKIPAAAQAYCIESEWKGASEDRRIALLAQCAEETSRHLAEDLK